MADRPPYNLGQIPHQATVQPLNYKHLHEMALLAVAEGLSPGHACSGRQVPRHPRPALWPVSEEFGEVAHEVTENLMQPGRSRQHLKDELIQLAACALAWATAVNITESEPEGLFAPEAAP